jgi:hypothetical protein
VPFPVRTLDGSNNNVLHPEWGRAGTLYVRVAQPTDADMVSVMVAGPAPRYTSNRIFNDVGQNLFSENGVSQLGMDVGMDAVVGVRRSTLAARLKAVYRTVDKVQAFVGLVSEEHFGAADHPHAVRDRLSAHAV